MVSMNELASIVMDIADKDLTVHHIPGPEGVRGRNSDNTLIREMLDWSPQITIKEGMAKTYEWIRAQVEEEEKNGVDVEAMYGKSTVVKQDMFD